MLKKLVFNFLFIGALILPRLCVAGEVPPLTVFEKNTPAVAAEVNGNFAAVKSAIDDNNARIVQLEQTVAALQASLTTLSTLQSDVTTHTSQIAAINNSNVMGLEPYLQIATGNTPRLTFKGINVQIVNGLNKTDSMNGVGNLIIGYDEADTSKLFRCTVGTNRTTLASVVDQKSCTEAGGQWTSLGFKTGSHYLIVGGENNYSGFGGIVAGNRNTSNYNYASVTGGFSSMASGLHAVVSGGNFNFAGGSYATVSGGNANHANQNSSAVSGGLANTTSGIYSSVSGGRYNTASGEAASVSGGSNNIASALTSNVSGGGNGTTNGGNAADQPYSSVLGGVGQKTSAAGQTIPMLP